MDIKRGGEYTAYENISSLHDKIHDIEKLESTTTKSDEATKLADEAQMIYTNTINKLNEYIAQSYDTLELNDTFTVTWSPNDKNKYTLQRQDELTFDSTSQLSNWVADVKRVFDIKMNDVKNEANTYVHDNNNANDAVSAFDQLLNDRNFQEIQKLERYVTYHMFYFPGGVPKLRINGHGIDTDEQEYDNLDVKIDPFANNWDPRYMVDYINAARQGGFHKWFISVVNSDDKTTFIPIQMLTLWAFHLSFLLSVSIW